MVIALPRSAASFWKHSIWWALPSTRASQSRCSSGSRLAHFGHDLGDDLGAGSGDAAGVPLVQGLRGAGRLPGRADHDVLRGAGRLRPAAGNRTPRRSRPSASSPAFPRSRAVCPLSCPVSRPSGRSPRAARPAASTRPWRPRTSPARPAVPPRPGAAMTGASGTGRACCELLRVRRGPRHDLLQLPFPGADPRRGQHEVVPVLERPGPARHLREPLQLPGMPARRQVQHRVPPVQVRHPLLPGPVGDPADPHPPQHRHHRRRGPLPAAPPLPVLPPSAPAAAPPRPPARPSPAAAPPARSSGPPPPPGAPCHPAAPPPPRPQTPPRPARPAAPAPGPRHSRPPPAPPAPDPPPARRPLPARRQPVHRIPFHRGFPSPSSDFAHQDLVRNGSLTHPRTRREPRKYPRRHTRTRLSGRRYETATKPGPGGTG